MPRRAPESPWVAVGFLVRAGLECEVGVGVEAEQPAVVDDDAAERDLVVDLARGGRGAGDEIHGVVLRSVLDDVLAVRGGARPVLVEQQSRRLALRVQEELAGAARLPVDGDWEGAAGGVAGLNGELVFEGEAAGEWRRRREGSSGRNGEHAARRPLRVRVVACRSPAWCAGPGRPVSRV